MALLVTHNSLRNAGLNMSKDIVIKNKEGFTLLELLVALVILSISLIAFANVIVISMRMNKQNDCRNAAVRLTSKTAEDFLAQPMGSLADGTTNSTVSLPIRGGALPYRVSSTIVTLNNDLKQINITVQYTISGQQYTNNAVIYKHRAV